MRSLRLHAPLDLRMHDEPVPQPGPGEALIRVGSVGVCASDVHWWRDGRIGSTVLAGPLVLGHEAAGTVEAAGEGGGWVTVGRRVAIEPARPCGKCELCASGHANVCPSIQFFGTPPTDGCFRDYITWPADLLLPVPDEVSMDEAAMLEPLAIGLYCVELAQVRPGESAAILGAGAIGLSVLQPLRLAGAGKILVSDPIGSRREAAGSLGADVVCSPAEAQSAADRLTAGRGLDIVFECAGEQDAVRDSARLARILGRVVIVGIPREDDYCLDASAARRKELTAVFARRSNATTERAIQLVRDRKVDVSSYVTHTFELERAADALALAESKADGILRAVIHVSDDRR